MERFTHYSIDKASYYGPAYLEERAQSAFQEDFERLYQACENTPGPDYGDCPAWDGLVDAMDQVKSIEQLRDLLSLMRAHGPACDSHELASSPAPQCAACMCDRKDVVSDRLVLGKPAAVCCGEVA